MRLLHGLWASIAIASLTICAGVIAPATASVTSAQQRAAVGKGEGNRPWSPPENAADGEAAAPNSPEEQWQPVDEARLDTAPDASSRGVAPLDAPVGTVAGKPGLGELPWFSFEDYELWEHSVLRVNLANGNLLVKANDSSIAVPGFGLRQDRFYNGLSTVAGTLGGGWQSNNGANDVGVVDAGSYVDYFAVNGTKFRFTVSGNIYTAADGSNLSLSKDMASTIARYVITSNKTAEQWKFSASGWLTSTFDRNGIGDNYTYASGKMALHGSW